MTGSDFTMTCFRFLEPVQKSYDSDGSKFVDDVMKVNAIRRKAAQPSKVLDMLREIRLRPSGQPQLTGHNAGNVAEPEAQ